MNVELFLETLPLMAKGMVGIFLVTLLLMGIIALLNKVTNPKN